jgi:transposase
MMRTASMRLEVSAQQAGALGRLRTAYTDACNRLVPIVGEHRLWNRVGLHQRAYRTLREATPLGSQMCCNAIGSVCKAYKSQSALGRIKKDGPVPPLRFDRASVHFDKRTYTLKHDTVSLNTLDGPITVAMRMGEHQRRMLAGGTPKEAELLCRQGQWFLNLVVESGEVQAVASGPVMGVDVGENKLAAHSLGKVFGGEHLRDQRNRCLAQRRRLQSNGSQSATLKAGKRMRGRLHRWAWRQLQSFVEYKAKAAGIAVEYVNPAYTSQTCSCCGALGKRSKHRFECAHCGLRAHSDLNASRNLARIGSGAPLSRAAVNTPDVGSVDGGNHICASQ